MLNRRTLPLSALRAFESAGHHLHMGRAGEALGVTHGAISHQIRALEQQLGVKLFIRANNRLQLTHAGQRLLDAVRRGFDIILDSTQHLDPGSLTGSLTIGCTQTAGASWLANHIGDFHSQYPQIEIHVMEVKPGQQDIPREIDIAVCYGKPRANGRRIEELARPDIFPVCSPRLLHGKPAITQPEHLARLPLLNNHQNDWTNWFATMDLPIPDQARQIYYFNTNLTLSAARQGHGVALCNRFEVREDLLEGRLIKLLNSTVPEAQSYFLLTDHPLEQSLRAQLLEEWIKQTLH